MKVHTIHTYENGDTIVKWYDPSYGWVLAVQASETGFQIGEASYVGPRDAVASELEYLINHKPKDL